MVHFIPIVELVRLEENYKYGTFGGLKINKQVFCVTLEPPDQENQPNISSIPAQQYICQRVETPTHGVTFEVLNVPGRTAVLFHPGNIIDHTEGCVLIAEHYGKLKEKRAVLNSGNTFKKFMAEMEGVEAFHLTIIEQY